MSVVEQNLGQRVAEQRRLVGMTRARLAEHVGVTVETISRLERGIVVPLLARIDDVARALGTELAELFRGPTSKPDSAAIARLVALARSKPVDDLELLLVLAERVLQRLDDREPF